MMRLFRSLRNRRTHSTYSISGSVAAGYEPVRQLFERNFARGIEEKSQLSVYVKGQMVVNLWGTSNCKRKGLVKTDRRTVPYDDDTLTCVYSCSKVLSAICMASLVEKGLLSYDDNVVDHWPEYGNGDDDKKLITVSDILCHRGGMHKFSKTLSLADIQRENIKKNSIGRVIEEQTLRFPPEEAATKTQYHMYTIGFILNEIFRRVDPQKRTIGESLREDFAEQLDADAFIGLKFEELSKSTPMSYISPRQVFLGSFRPKWLGRKVQCTLRDMLQRTIEIVRMTNKSKSMSVPAVEFMNSSPSAFLMSIIKTAELPSVNAQATAKGLAKIASMMASKGKMEGVRYFSKTTWDLLHSDFIARPMYPHNGTTNFSLGGVNLFDTVEKSVEFFKANEHRKGFVGWLGFGGAAMQWHPELEIGFSYVPTLVSWEDPANTKAALLQEKIMDCLTEIGETNLTSEH